jgi:hypothetical protein
MQGTVMVLFADLLICICDMLPHMKIRKAGCYGLSVPVGFQYIKLLG